MSPESSRWPSSSQPGTMPQVEDALLYKQGVSLRRAKMRAKMRANWHEQATLTKSARLYCAFPAYTSRIPLCGGVEMALPTVFECWV